MTSNAAPGVAGPLGNATSAVVVGGFFSKAAQLLTGAGVTIARDLTIGANSFNTPTIGGGAGESWYTGALSIPYPVQLTAEAGARVHFAGPISGVYDITKIGPGTVLLENANAYRSTFVNAGLLLVDNTIGSGTVAGTVFVNAGEVGGSGTISGGLIVGNASGTADAAVSPGDGLGTLHTGAVTFKSDGVLKLEIDSTHQTSDLLSAAGAVQLGNAVLTPTDLGTSVMTPGWQFTLIENTSAATTTGTFKNLPDGAIFRAGANYYALNYAAALGSDGVANDVIATVTSVPEPGAATLLVLAAACVAAFRWSSRSELTHALKKGRS